MEKLKRDSKKINADPFVFAEMAHQVAQVILRCETAETEKHLGNKTMPNFLLLLKMKMKMKKTNEKPAFLLCDSITVSKQSSCAQ